MKAKDLRLQSSMVPDDRNRARGGARHLWDRGLEGKPVAVVTILQGERCQEG